MMSNPFKASSQQGTAYAGGAGESEVADAPYGVLLALGGQGRPTKWGKTHGDRGLGQRYLGPAGARQVRRAS